jgi:hypothetical protein
MINFNHFFIQPAPGGQVYLYAEICTQMPMHSKSTEYILIHKIISAIWLINLN